MEKPRVLSGRALVAKGITKIDASLPEIGLKDVTPNGSWLEQKQIQAALEARKYLIEVERIEKCGTLSQAEWRDDLMLAEVTQKAGGYWQYLGHNVGKTLYLRPEEALFLMEVNCLLLKHNEVTVSLQKAYSLLLRSSTTMIQYRVYASLSRLGYKLFRHKTPKVNNQKKLCPPKVHVVNESENIDSPTVSTENQSENVYSPIVSTAKQSENVDSLTFSTENQSVNVDLPTVGTYMKPDNVDSPTISTIIKSENIDAPTTPNTGKELENIDPKIINTVIKLENVDIQINNMVNKSEFVDSPIQSQVNNVSENNNQEENTHSEPNNDIAEISKDRGNEEITEINVTNSDLAKENESPIVMEVDETAELKVAGNLSQCDSIQEESSTITQSNTATDTNDVNINIGDDITNKNVDHTTDSMEINNETRDAGDSGIVLMVEHTERNKDSEAATAEEVNTMIIDVAANSGGLSLQEGNDASTLKLEGVRTDTAIDSGTQIIEDNTNVQEYLPKKNEPGTSNNSTATDNFTQTFYSKNNHLVYYNLSKIEKLTKRRLKPCDSKSIEKHFENIPELFKKQVVTVNVPEQQFIPTNIYVNNSNYLLNLQNIKKRSLRTTSTESSSYTSSDEVNGANVRRIRSSSGTEFPHNLNFFPHSRFPRQHHFRPYGFWRPQNNLNYYQFSMYFQRPSFPNLYFQSRVQYLPRPNTFLRSYSYPSNLNQNTPNIGHNARKRMRTGRTAHLQGIKNLAVRLKQFVMSGSTEIENIESLHSQLHSYNLRYKSRLRLTEHFDVVNEEKILETIELDDDDESKSKKPKLDPDDSDKFDENLYSLRQLALRLRDLETKDKATASHRRAFSKAIKTFNKSYNADVYLDDNNYEVIDRRCITLESSSESDCVVEEEPKVHEGKGKKLRNPFNILKRRSERLQSLNNPGTSKDDNASDASKTEPNRAESEDSNIYNELLLKTFDETWLPNDKDFGRAEIVPKPLMNVRLADSCKEQYLYDFMKDQFDQYQNWLDAKISFLRHLEETNIAFQNEQARMLADSELRNIGLRPLVDFEDSSDLTVPLLAEKLNIIKNNKEINTETSLIIDFDVYNRDVQNFRKTNPPKPHFRIICIDQSSSLPSAVQVMALHSKYEDNVPIVFALVGIGSVSYLQINPIDLPKIKCKYNDIV